MIVVHHYPGNRCNNKKNRNCCDQDGDAFAGGKFIQEPLLLRFAILGKTYFLGFRAGMRV